MSVAVKALTKKFGDQVAVNNVSFSVGPGEVVGFLGPNGAGKTTTLRMIVGFTEPDAGEIEVCGVKAGSGSLKIRENIGYLPETTPVYGYMYVREYLRFVCGVKGISGNKKAVVEDMIDRTGLRPEAAKRIGQLSKGYRQRVGLAQAMLSDPQVLLLDEPTSGLDPNQLVEVREIIRGLGKRKTVILSTHILQEAKAICSRVLIIHNGSLVADEPIESLGRLQRGGGMVTVEFKSPVEPGWYKGLTKVSGAQSADNRVWEVTAQDADLAREEIFMHAAANGLTLVSLHKRETDLESVFRDLTER